MNGYSLVPEQHCVGYMNADCEVSAARKQYCLSATATALYGTDISHTEK